MKKIYLSIIVLLAVVTSQAQVPQAFSYQAVIRNTSNALVANQLVNERISLVKDSATGTVVYSELQSVKTNANGLVSLQIGTGSVLSGSFSSINWATGTYFIKTETDPTGGSKYTISNTTQLLSVPYALQAGSAPSLQYPDGMTNITPVILDTTTKNASFTVPPGKNFYFYCLNYQGFSKVDSDLINEGGGPVLIILGPNQVVTNIKQLYRVNLGFTVDKTVEVVFQNLSKGDYSVPQGKVFVLFNTYLLESPFYFNGIQGGYANIPIIIPSGTIISGKGILNGYLR